jgi:predicted nucleic acid-binding Zn ribbon protein
VSRSFDGPRALGDSLRQLAQRYRRVDIAAVDEVRRRWPEVVGEALAARCEPQYVREGVLVVRVPSGAFAQRLRMEEGTIIDALSDLGDRAPTTVRIVVGEAPDTRR